MAAERSPGSPQVNHGVDTTGASNGVHARAVAVEDVSRLAIHWILLASRRRVSNNSRRHAPRRLHVVAQANALSEPTRRLARHRPAVLEVAAVGAELLLIRISRTRVRRRGHASQYCCRRYGERSDGRSENFGGAQFFLSGPRRFRVRLTPVSTAAICTGAVGYQYPKLAGQGPSSPSPSAAGSVLSREMGSLFGRVPECRWESPLCGSPQRDPRRVAGARSPHARRIHAGEAERKRAPARSS